MKWAAIGVLVGCRIAPAPVSDLPASIDTPVGRVAVVRLPAAAVDSGNALGLWEWDRQTITIAAGLPSRVAWHTLYHEACHVAFDASGQSYAVAGDRQEAVCDAIATARVRESGR